MAAEGVHVPQQNSRHLFDSGIVAISAAELGTDVVVSQLIPFGLAVRAGKDW